MGVRINDPGIGDIFIPGPYPSAPLSSYSAVAVSGAATLNTTCGQVTTESLTLAQDGIYTLTITCSYAAAGHKVFCNVENGSNTVGIPGVATATLANGKITVVIVNHGATPLNGTLLLDFVLMKSAASL
jgi:hypothetical protein